MGLMINGRKVVDLVLDGVDRRDYPDFCDAYFDSGMYADDGSDLSDDDLDKMKNLYPDVLWSMCHKQFC
jgi:hypothetical protein